MGWFMSGTLIGPAIGPFIGGIIVTFKSWRVIFWLQAALAGAACLGAYFLYVLLSVYLPKHINPGVTPGHRFALSHTFALSTNTILQPPRNHPPQKVRRPHRPPPPPQSLHSLGNVQSLARRPSLPLPKSHYRRPRLLLSSLEHVLPPHPHPLLP